MSSDPAPKKRKVSNNNNEVTDADMSDVLQNSTGTATDSSEALIHSEDPLHPANHICTLCRQFYTHGWVTGTGGGVSIRNDKHIFIAPSGVQKELMQPTDMFVMDWESKAYLRRPAVGCEHSHAHTWHGAVRADGRGRFSNLQHVHLSFLRLSPSGMPAAVSILIRSGPCS